MRGGRTTLLGPLQVRNISLYIHTGWSWRFTVGSQWAVRWSKDFGLQHYAPTKQERRWWWSHLLPLIACVDKRVKCLTQSNRTCPTWHCPDTLQDKKKKLRGLKSASELYRPSDRRLSAKLVPTSVDRGCHVVSVTDPYGRFLNRSRYFFFQIAPQLCSRGWVDPAPDPLLFRKSGSAGNRKRTSGSKARNSDLLTINPK
jgi:hypothetical protein